MTTIAQQESFVKESLFQFIIKNIPSADLSVIDDIVLSYVISILEEASQDPCFDVEGFIEMMAAYVPQFARLDSLKVCKWVIDLEAELSGREECDSLSNHDDSAGSDKISLTMQSLNDMLPPVNKTNRSHSNSESSGSESNAEGGRQTSMETEHCRLLHEMFPNTCSMEIRHCVSIARGDMERATATLLARIEQGQALSGSLNPAHHIRPAARHTQCGDDELKNRIIARYSYVDKNSDMKEHKPLAPKMEPKKMVRYRDNKIVSLKGERYTEVPKSGVEEEHLKKPKKQHCP